MYRVPDYLPNLYQPLEITYNAPKTARQWALLLEQCEAQIRCAYDKVEACEQVLDGLEVEYHKVLDRVLDFEDYLNRKPAAEWGIKNDKWFLDSLEQQELARGKEMLKEMEERIEIQRKLAMDSEQDKEALLAKAPTLHSSLVHRVNACVDIRESMDYGADAANFFKFNFAKECRTRRGDLNAARHRRKEAAEGRTLWRDKRFAEHEQARTNNVKQSTPQPAPSAGAAPKEPEEGEFLFNPNAAGNKRWRPNLFTPRTDSNQHSSSTFDRDNRRSRFSGSQKASKPEPRTAPRPSAGSGFQSRPGPPPPTSPPPAPPSPPKYQAPPRLQQPSRPFHPWGSRGRVQKPAGPNVFEEWHKVVNSSLADYPSMMGFPDPPAGHCKLIKCRNEVRTLIACEHDIEHAFSQINGLNLKRERLRWHPDKFSACPASKRETFQKKAAEIFRVLNDMFQTS